MHLVLVHHGGLGLLVQCVLITDLLCLHLLLLLEAKHLLVLKHLLRLLLLTLVVHYLDVAEAERVVHLVVLSILLSMHVVFRHCLLLLDHLIHILLLLSIVLLLNVEVHLLEIQLSLWVLLLHHVLHLLILLLLLIQHLLLLSVHHHV